MTAGTTVEDVVVPIDDKSPLNTIGGSTIVDSSVGKVIVVRTGETTFVAFSAICTHKHGTVEYNPTKKLFECPKHHSKFDSTDGSVLDGPADDPLPKYAAHGDAKLVTVSTGI
jgi:cytochrome b6-f complex iron-sulfur subunit